MKRWFIGLTACLIAAVGLSQESSEKQDVSVEKNGGTISISSGGVTPYSGTPVLGDIIYFDGTNWVSLAKPADGAYNVTFTASIPSWTASSGAVPTGTGFYHTTAGVMDAASIKVDVSSTAQITGTMAVGNGGTGQTAPTAHGVLIGEGASATTTTSAGTAGQVLVSQGASADPIFDRCVPSPTMVCYFDDFASNLASSAAVAAGTFFRCNATGTSAGCNTAVASGIVDANTVGVWEGTTGTSSTGTFSIAGAGFSAGTGPTTGGLLISGGEVFQARIYIPVASDGTNTFSSCFGFYNAGSVTDTLNICWDNNSDTHWTIQARKASTGNPVTSNLVATAAAWHTLKITVDAAAAAAHFYVDGAELNVSPLNSNIPNTVVTVLNALRLTSSLSSNAKVGEIDYAYFMKPVTR